LNATTVRCGAHFCFALAFLVGGYLVLRGGWPIVIVGVASTLSAYAYSAGPWRISHSNLGELFVLVFFGLIAVGGTYYLQTGSVTAQSLLAGAYVGAPACAVLVVNNHRDRAEDLRAGRRTLSILAGETGSKAIYGGLLAVPFVLLPLLGADERFWWWLPLLVAPLAVSLARRLWVERLGPGLNLVLARTSQLQLMLGVALACAWLLPRQFS
jgi:1,4-dihydroxy-2-naphthoate octaprenyltransferase